jgi:hypothetical protein
VPSGGNADFLTACPSPLAEARQEPYTQYRRSLREQTSIEGYPMRSLATVIVMVGSMFAMLIAALAQQSETGPAQTKNAAPMRSQETGTRGPSGGAPETGYHGPRDVTKDAEPGKKKSPNELRQSGQSREGSKTKQN